MPHAKSCKRLVAVLALSSLLAAPSQAEVKEWNKTSGGDFQTPANWTPVGAPGMADQALFNLGTAGYTVTLLGNATVDEFTVATDVVDLNLSGFQLDFGGASLTGFELLVGGQSNGRLTIRNGTVIGGAYVAEVVGSFGELIIDNATFDAVRGVCAGCFGGDGSLHLTNGGSLTAAGIFLGSLGPNSIGTLLVDDASTIVTDVFEMAAGSATITGLGTTFTKTTCCDVAIGLGLSNEGFLRVDQGAVATFDQNNWFVGRGGAVGTLEVDSGGQVQVTNGNSFVGGCATGIATVSGAGSSWTTSGNLNVGEGNCGVNGIGDGELIISGGGSVQCLSSVMGQGEGTAGTVLVTGAGSEWNAIADIVVGYEATGVLTVSNGAQVISSVGRVGDLPGSNGVATISDAGSEWETGYFNLGGNGVGELNLENGASLTVTGGLVDLGGGGSATLTISSGAMMDASSAAARLVDGISTLQLSVDGAGSTLLADGFFTNNGAARIEVTNGGVIQTPGGVTLGLCAGCPSLGACPCFGDILVSGSGSSLTSGDILSVGFVGPGSVEVTAGGQVSALSCDVSPLFGTGLVDVHGIGAAFDVTNTFAFGGDGSGEVRVRNSGTITCSLGIIGSLGKLGGNSVFVGEVLNGGQVAPGSSIGELTIDGDFTNVGGGTVAIELSNSGNDKLVVTGEATLDGTLKILVPDEFTPLPGSSFEIMSWALRVGQFATVDRPTFDDGLAFSLRYEANSLFLDVDVDCNLNGVGDAEDILLGNSLDLDNNDIPDECVEFIDGCDPVPDWSCPGNWDLAGLFPDNAAATYSVTLDSPADAVCLDVDVEIDTLRIVDGASLDMTGAGGCDGDLALAQPGGMLLADGSSLTVGPGELIDGTPAGGADLVIRGDSILRVDDATLNLGGDMLLEFGGVYESTPAVTSPPNAATLDVNDLTIRRGTGGGNSGRMTLSEDMEVTVSGDLVLDGIGTALGCGCAPFGQRARGGQTPPVISVFNNGRLGIFGHWSLLGAADVVLNSSQAVLLGGDFINNTVCPTCFNCVQGRLRLNGVGPQAYEVGATDLGAIGAVSGQPYEFQRIEIASGGSVTFRDGFDNAGDGQSPCSEALYVQELVLEAGTTTTLSNARVYYESIALDPAATVTRVGCGDLRPVSCPPVDSALPEYDIQPKNRYLAFRLGNAGVQTAIRVRLTSLTGFGSFNGQVRWVGPPVLQPEGNGGQFWAAPLQCVPHFMDWSTVDQVHVFGAAVVPSSTYDIQLVHFNCASVLNDEFSYSSPLQVVTGKWGDVRDPYGAAQPTFADISAIVSKFVGQPSAIGKARAQLQPNVPNPAVLISFADISACVTAFTGSPYPFAGPSNCP